MSDPVISVQGASKVYRIWESPSARLTAPLLETVSRLFPGALGRWLRNRAARSYRDFWALKDISFEVRRGESVGIIGRNGSGKSTLLQIIAGTLQPTEGSVKVSGRVAALLELGSGFNPEFTGRENVYLNGAVLGLSRREIDARFDDIASFADIGEFMDQPVKTYSSGMVMRLAFSVQTSVDPDILIVDEALAVGDVQFVAKCINRISDFIGSGRTLLFVSHDIGSVKQLTTRALFLERGVQEAFGATTETVLAYTNRLRVPATNTLGNPERYEREDATYHFNELILSRPGGEAQLTAFASGEPVRLSVKLRPVRKGNSRLIFSIYNYMGIIVCSSETPLPESEAGNGLLAVEFELPSVRLAPGSYHINFAIRDGIEIVAWAKNAIHFNVTGDTTETFIYREDISVSFRRPD